MTFFLLLLLGVSFTCWLVLKNRVADLQSKLDRLGEQSAASGEREISALTARVYRLEQAIARSSAGAATMVEVPPPPTVTTPVPEPPPLTVVEPPPIQAIVPSFAAALETGPTLSERLRQKLGGSEWEALLGGSILNKLGALVLVVGIALFLAYSFTYMAPAGRASISALLSLAILGVGIWVERKQTYRIFSRGLIGAGWAGLYATAYAMYALPAARVIGNPFGGSLLLLAVALGMIAHSLRYRAQAVTSIAFFTAFAALAATPATPFAVSALVPLAVALLYLAWRFEWYNMALFGLGATWGACISRGASPASLASSESLFILYWLIFEGFDLLRLRRGNREKLLEFILPINGIAFLGLSYATWTSHDPAEIWRMAALAAALYLLSAMVRLALGSRYEAALTVAAALGGLALFRRAPGLWSSVGIALEAELLYLAGVRFRLRFMRLLGSAAFSFSLGSVLAKRGQPFKHSDLLGLSLHDWTPPVLLHAFLFYLNRYLWRPNLRFSYTATALVSLVLVVEVKSGFEGLALLPLALLLLELGLRKSLAEFRLQAYALVVLSGLIILATHLEHFTVHPPTAVWLSTVSMVLACWYITARVLSAAPMAEIASEQMLARDLSAALGSAYALLTLWMLLPEPFVSLAWFLLAMLWVESGFARRLQTFRRIGYAIVVLANFELYRVDVLRDNWTVWLENGIPILVGLYYLWSRIEYVAPSLPRTTAARAPLWLGAALVFTVSFNATGALWVAAAWALLSFLFLVAGVRLANVDFRLQGYIGIALVALRCVTTNFADATAATRPQRIAASLLAVTMLLAGQYLLRVWPCHSDRERMPLDAYAKQYVSVAAVFLLSGLLCHEVSGSLLTVAWGIEGVALLAAGLTFRERILRLEGLVLLITCILKLFVYDLRNLETVYRILSFIALGVILLGVSWTYTRFRERLKHYL